MKLIIGGAYQGKSAYALAHFEEEKIVPNVHLFVLSLMDQGKDPLSYMEAHWATYDDKILICEDIFCGIVPMDDRLRQWREVLGRTVTFLAQNSDEVIRVFCGIGTKIK